MRRGFEELLSPANFAEPGKYAPWGQNPENLPKLEKLHTNLSAVFLIYRTIFY
jgi:hypothetical protein